MRPLTDRDPHTPWEVAKMLRLAALYAKAEKRGDERLMARCERDADRITEGAAKREERVEKERQAEAERNSREAKRARRQQEQRDKQAQAKQLREARQHKARLDRENRR